MKKRFITGLTIILPLAITAWILLILIHLCTRPFLALTHATLAELGLFETGFWIFSNDQVVSTVSTSLILVCLFVFLFIIGFITQKLFFHVVIQAFERLLLRIPLLNKVYQACHDFTRVILSPKASSFSKVVWAPFPTDKQRALGLVTNEVSVGASKKLVSVLVPGTPNPMHGFLILCPQEMLVSVPLSTNEGMKWIISCGSSCNDPVMRSTEAISQKAL